MLGGGGGSEACCLLAGLTGLAFSCGTVDLASSDLDRLYCIRTRTTEHVVELDMDWWRENTSFSYGWAWTCPSRRCTHILYMAVDRLC